MNSTSDSSDGSADNESNAFDQQEIVIQDSSDMGDGHSEAAEEVAVTPVNRVSAGVLFFITISEGLSLNFYNTISALMMTYQFGVPVDQVGYYVGYLATAYSIGQLLCNIPLCMLSDRIGRRPVILFGVTCNIISQLVFGLSKWFWFAVLVRFLNGLTTANLPLTKCYTREISDITNQAKLFSYRSMGFSVGAMLAPLIGSVFSRPADQDWIGIPLFGIDLFVEFPYLLVCIVVSILDILCLLVIIGYMPETLPSKVKKNKEQEADIEIEMDTLFDEEMNAEDLESKDEDSLLGNEVKVPILPIRSCFALVDRGVVVSLLLYIIISFICPLITQVVPVWAARKPEQHGLSFEEQQLGIMYSVGSVSALLFQFSLFARIDKWIGSSNSFRGSLALYMPVIFFLPFITFFVDYSIVLTVLLLLLYALFVIQLSWAFGSVNVLISNSARSEIVGTVNGVGTTLASISKLAAPVIGDTLFAWSANLDWFYPFDYMFVFHACVLLCCICMLCTLFLPHSLNRSRTE